MNMRLTGVRGFALPHIPLPEDAPEGGANGGSGGQGGDGGQGAASGQGGASYTPPATQADLDRIVQERLGRERSRYADYDDLKAKAEAHDQAVEAAKTETQRAVDDARKAGRDEVLQQANSRLVNAEARALAAAARFRNPTVAVSSIDLSKVAVDEHGQVDAAAIKTALDALATSDPYLVDDGKRGRPAPDPTQGGRGGEKTGLAGLSGSELYERMHPSRTKTA